MTAYVDYSYYTGTFLGTAIPSADFARYALRATAQVDLVTFNRAAAVMAAATDSSKMDKIKMATCAVAEALQVIELSGGDDKIQSESIGSNSVTYAQGSVKQMSNTDKVATAARTYLQGTGLMFRGFADGEM